MAFWGWSNMTWRRPEERELTLQEASAERYRTFAVQAKGNWGGAPTQEGSIASKEFL